ncbi:uncharacterized protein ACLA_050670 [Aspergillus clavatus NRRL 1]|uniref:F-box domain protein n=1 Tax=Aspergillus clavatus (strain ATCC 1007 / CBS 513.65 / DSM 816 / NCTC 3887 / NRRL 1 / QM 1276 / 107) TaxID=344612 RepID=A1CI90_ASPCL|nr:F-box domain protein [Aspergillus clavatus NRRL 1]EAW10595.1 F-box domain protein [Aspergillus clavatus NRRL 1]
MSVESPGQKTGFRAFMANALRPKKSRQVLRKNTASTPNLRAATRSSIASEDVPPPVPVLAPLEAHRVYYREKNAEIDTQIGENRDHTAMLHSLGIHDTEDSDAFASDRYGEDRPPGEPMIASLSSDLWAMIAEELDPGDVASLAFASKTLLSRLERLEPWSVLNQPENREYRVNFLAPQDRRLPHHLLCMTCAKYHRRTQEGREKLQPAAVVNPLFDCPNLRNPLLPAPRHRITHGRMLYFTFVQLALRAHRFGPAYGISTESLSRRWRRDGWTHQSRYIIHKNRLLMRVVSQTFAAPALTPSSQRLLLYSREDYWPYFSACAHWRDGQLMDACKCALGHIPKPRDTAGLQGLEHRAKDLYHHRMYNPNELATLCNTCRPMRRCPDCPSEYLIEVKLTEDRIDPKSLRFRHAIVVTRWCDLGDGSSSHGSAEWAACNGLREYDSFAALTKRSISGTFEAAFTDDTLPGQRIVSMNPKGKRLGEAGNSWY